MFGELNNLFRHLKVYLLGKGILTLGVFAAAGVASAMGFSVLVPALVIGIGGTLLTAANRFYQESIYRDDMVNLYRDDIANQLGKDPKDVTRADLRAAAQDNDVIAQAMKRYRQVTWLNIGTAALAGAVSIGLIVGFGLDGKHIQDVAKHTLWTALAPLASYVGIGTISGLSGLVLHQGLGQAIGYGTGIGKAAAHDLIVSMDSHIKRGIPVSREDVYAIVLAANPKLERTIAEHYDKSYSSMNHAQKAHVLHDVHLADTLDKIAHAINVREVRAGYMAYAVSDARLNLPPQKTPEKPKAVNDHEQAQGKFTERLNLTPRIAASHANRVMQERAEPAQGYSAIL